MWKLPDGKIIRVAQDVTIDDTVYPAAIFGRWSKENLARLGIKPYRIQAYDPEIFRPTAQLEVEADGVITLTYTLERIKSEADVLAEKIEDKFWSCNEAVNQYIYSHYDQGTQSSFIAFYAKPNTSAELKTAIEGVHTWIAMVMGYYYQMKAAILGATDEETLNAITWDFKQFDASKPDVTLGGIYAVLSQ